MIVATYLVNLLCAVVECRGTMAPPEAYIAEYSAPSPIQTSTIKSSSSFEPHPLNISDSVGASTTNLDDNTLRTKRLFPVYNASIEETEQPGRRSFSLQSTMSDVINSIPKFVNSVSRIMQNGNNNLESSGIMNSFRVGRNRNGRDHRGSGDKQPLVVLRDGGGLEGYYMGTMNGRKIAAYEGIPYAEPPIGNRRFKSPVPKARWEGIRAAKKPGNTCLQTHPLYFFRVTGDENCLFLNVYTPKMPDTEDREPLPVIVFIHGGSFIYGCGSEYGGAYLNDQDVILVTFNYRLGALGFLSTGDAESPGNYGLKDQALVLKWIHDNIATFGGDPTRVTISGQSAGGVSAHLHLVANKVPDYFQNGVSLSGSGFGFWPVLTKERAGRLTRSLAKRLNCQYRTSTELMRCLRRISGSWIIMTQLHLFDWIPFHPLVLFAPVVEPEGPNSYLTKSPQDAYAQYEVPRKPWIFGQTFKEGHFETYLLKLFMQTPNMALNGKKYLPMILDYDFFTTEPVTSGVTQRLLEYYDGNSLGNGISMDTISDMYTDRYFSNTLQQAIRAHSQLAPKQTFAYIYDYVGKYNLGELFGVPKAEWGAAHTEDVMMMFNSSSFHHGLSKRDVEYQLSEIMTNILSNFATTGNPVYRTSSGNVVTMWDTAINPHGDPRSDHIRYLRFGKNVSMIKDPYRDRVKLWNSLGISV